MEMKQTVLWSALSGVWRAALAQPIVAAAARARRRRTELRSALNAVWRAEQIQPPVAGVVPTPMSSQVAKTTVGCARETSMRGAWHRVVRWMNVVRTPPKPIELVSTHRVVRLEARSPARLTNSVSKRAATRVARRTNADSGVGVSSQKFALFGLPFRSERLRRPDRVQRPQMRR